MDIDWMRTFEVAHNWFAIVGVALTIRWVCEPLLQLRRDQRERDRRYVQALRYLREQELGI